MPTYEYKCENCGFETEKLQKMSDAPLTLCEKCNRETLKRGFGGGIGLSFQGSGFYITDYGSTKSEPCPCGKKDTPCTDK
ncbi:MAG: FmdB family zinc ribbon protein [Chlamydiota bacterium]|nr:FmdB family zinc ribbon protein [Chlamydiota bacterium]